MANIRKAAWDPIPRQFFGCSFVTSISSKSEGEMIKEIYICFRSACFRKGKGVLDIAHYRKVVKM
jgi:hypothetical protein